MLTEELKKEILAWLEESAELEFTTDSYNERMTVSLKLEGITIASDWVYHKEG